MYKDTLMIGIDRSNGIDYTAVIYLCSQCCHILEVNVFKPHHEGPIFDDKINMCPNCGTEFIDTHICV